MEELIYHQCAVTEVFHPLWELQKISVKFDNASRVLIVHVGVYDATIDSIKRGRFQEYVRMVRSLKNI